MARRAMRWGLGTLGVGAGFTALSGHNPLAWAGSSTSMAAVFNEYASVGEDGVASMNTQDFLRSIVKVVGEDDDWSVPDSTMKNIEDLFRALDANSDGVLVFSEFYLLITLLIHSVEELKKVCQVYDGNRNGKMTRQDFQDIIHALGGASHVDVSLGGITDSLFDGKKNLTHTRLLSYVETLQQRVLRAEFEMLADGDLVPLDAYVSKIFGGEEELPEGLQDQMGRLKRESLNGGGVRFSTFQTMRELADFAGPLSVALDMYTKTGRDVAPRDLVRAIKCARQDGVAGLKPHDVEAIFKLFGSPDDTLLVPEFIEALERTQSWGMRRQCRSEPKRNFPQALFKCLTRGQAD